jgi:hypothetical protein
VAGLPSRIIVWVVLVNSSDVGQNAAYFAPGGMDKAHFPISGFGGWPLALATVKNRIAVMLRSFFTFVS